MRLPAWLTGLNADGSAYIRNGWGIFASHINIAGERYMSRWLVQTSFGTIKLHHIVRPDREQDPHDHASDFTSLILSGGYTEERVFPSVDAALVEMAIGDTQQGHRLYRVVTAGEVVRRTVADFHRLIYVAPNTWTLVWFGPKVQSWGFLTREGKVPWKTYLGITGG